MYNFDEITDRSGTLSCKWDIAEGELPMWIADMDFAVAEPIREAICKRAEHGIYGYSYTPDEYFESVSRFFERNHGFKIPAEYMVYTSGVVAAISSMVRKLTTPAEKVLIQAPVYNIFYNSILNNGRVVLSSDLVYENGEYHIDFADLEEKMADKQTSLMILCNPHNPVGKVWCKQELAKIGDLAKKYGVTVISDEIHCDITKPGVEYVPFASVSDVCADISVTCIAPSKTFNIAGLQSAIAYAKNPVLRHKVFRGVNTDEVGEPNVFAMQAGIAAYSECDEWVKAMREYVFENKAIAKEYIERNIPELHLVPSDATYLSWIDISAVSNDSVDFTKRLREATGLFLNDGAEYGESGRAFVRMNLGTQRTRVLDGLERLERFVNGLK